VLVTLAAALVAAGGFLVLPVLESHTAIFVDLALVGTASFGLYTAALTLLGDRYQGGMLLAGSAAFALAYSVGSAAGTVTFGAAMEFATAAGGPVAVGLTVLIFATVFAFTGRRRM
jgi:hypothetical protein